MNTLKYNSTHLENIKGRFEEKTGVILTAKPRRFRTRGLIAVICVAALFLVIAVPIMAANIPAVSKIIHAVFPSADWCFTAVNKADEQNGIKMEVISSYIQGDTAEIYITLQDLTDDRVDETTDLLDSYSIDTPFDCLLGCHLTEYDEETKTATFLITVTTFGGKDVAGDRITFSLREFMSQKVTEGVDIPVVLAVESTSTQEVETYSYGGPDYTDYDYTYEPTKVFTALVPDVPRGFTVEGVNLTGVGYVDGQLHIQYTIDDNLSGYSNAYFYLKDKDGNHVDYNYLFSFWPESDDPNLAYCENVFDIPLDEIDQYTLYGDFSIAGEITQGDWQVTFYAG